MGWSEVFVERFYVAVSGRICSFGAKLVAEPERQRVLGRQAKTEARYMRRLTRHRGHKAMGTLGRLTRGAERASVGKGRRTRMPRLPEHPDGLQPRWCLLTDQLSFREVSSTCHLIRKMFQPAVFSPGMRPTRRPKGSRRAEYIPSQPRKSVSWDRVATLGGAWLKVLSNQDLSYPGAAGLLPCSLPSFEGH